MLNVKRLKKFFSLSLFLSSGRSKQNISKYFDWKRKTTLCTIRANVQPTTVFGVRVAFLLFQYGKRSTEANDLLPPLYVILKMATRKDRSSLYWQMQLETIRKRQMYTIWMSLAKRCKFTGLLFPFA